MTIKIYSTPACTYCKMAKEFLTSHNVPFEDIDVSVDAVQRDEMVEKSGQLGVPVFDIDGQIMVGYNQQLLSKVVGIGAASSTSTIATSGSVGTAGAETNNASN
jgi:glutaredoxin 3